MQTSPTLVPVVRIIIAGLPVLYPLLGATPGTQVEHLLLLLAIPTYKVVDKTQIVVQIGHAVLLKRAFEMVCLELIYSNCDKYCIRNMYIFELGEMHFSKNSKHGSN